MKGERAAEQWRAHPGGAGGRSTDATHRDGAEGVRSPRRGNVEARPQRAVQRHRGVRSDGTTPQARQGRESSTDEGQILDEGEFRGRCVSMCVYIFA